MPLTTLGGRSRQTPMLTHQLSHSKCLPLDGPCPDPAAEISLDPPRRGIVLQLSSRAALCEWQVTLHIISPISKFNNAAQYPRPAVFGMPDPSTSFHEAIMKSCGTGCIRSYKVTETNCDKDAWAVLIVLEEQVT